MGEHHIEILLGARRVGKTSIMESLINQLLGSGVKPKRILFITADNPFLAKVSLSDLIAAYMKQEELATMDEMYIFIDEIQDIVGWQLVLKYYYDSYKIKFVVSGSSSLLINQQAKKLTGRINLNTVWPLAWGEVKLFNRNYSFEKYLDYGGYPEIVIGLPDPARATLQIVDSTVYRDLLGLYGIQNPKILIDLIRLMSEKVGTPISYRSMGKQLDIDDTTAKKLIEYLISIKLIFALPLFTTSTKKALRNPSKYYFLDNGIISCYSLHKTSGALAENLVAICLSQRYAKSGVNYGYAIEDAQETDFVYGKDRYEVKYRDDWKDFVDDYESNDAISPTQLTLIVPKDTNIEHPHHKYVGLERFVG
jgi:predicted AAA+ superfamily ATPase